jgi:hypothetical protein
MPYNLHMSSEVDKPPHVPLAELPEFFQSLTATQMVQAALGLDLPVTTLLDISVSLVS